jgi:ABC-type glycerol-3-phosphate transport system permease component
MIIIVTLMMTIAAAIVAYNMAAKLGRNTGYAVAGAIVFGWFAPVYYLWRGWQKSNRESVTPPPKTPWTYEETEAALRAFLETQAKKQSPQKESPPVPPNKTLNQLAVGFLVVVGLVMLAGLVANIVLG